MIRKYSIAVLFVALAALTLRAQDPMTYSYLPHWPVSANHFHNSLTFSGDYTAGSDALTNSFLNSFYQGKFIDSSMKADQEKRLLPSNRLGIYTSYSAAYSWRNRADSTKWEFLLAYRDRQLLFGQFAPDAFKLAFEGNRPFLGRTAIVDDTRLTAMHWQQVQLEAKYYSNDNRSEAAFGISLLNGQRMQEISVRQGKVFTDNDGTFIDVTSHATYYQSDTTATAWGRMNGYGTCFNFRFSTILGDSASQFHHQVSFMVQDLGYIRWNDRSLIYSVDTTVHFTGADASNVVVNGGTVTGPPSSDSIIGKPQRGQVITFLPLGIRFRYALITNYPWWGGVDIRAWSYADAAPHFTLFGGWHSPNYRFNVTGGAAWGGYARFQVPVQVGWEPCRYLRMVIGTTNLAGYIAPAKTHGQGAYANLSFAF